jgi:hypothetical protein
MTSLFGKPQMRSTRTDGLRVAWRQGIYEKAGVGTLWIDVLGEKEYEMTGVPRMYYNQLRMREDGVELMNQLMRMYGA